MGRKVKRSLIEGFTLIEMSIVLAILGLLAGGILLGQSLLKNQRLRQAANNAIAHLNAGLAFRQQYGYLPGDFPTATQVWGRSDGGTPLTSNCASPYFDNSNPQGVCNGNGDNLILGHEPTRAWQHLANAGYISGTYTGVSIFSAPVPPRTYPAGPHTNSVYIFTPNGTGSYYFSGDYSYVLSYSAYLNASTPGGGPIVSAKDAYQIDTKQDDGSPASGNITAYRQLAYFAPDCANGSTASAAYQRTDAKADCALLFRAPLVDNK